MNLTEVKNLIQSNKMRYLDLQLQTSKGGGDVEYQEMSIFLPDFIVSKLPEFFEFYASDFVGIEEGIEDDDSYVHVEFLNNLGVSPTISEEYGIVTVGKPGEEGMTSKRVRNLFKEDIYKLIYNYDLEPFCDKEVEKNFVRDYLDTKEQMENFNRLVLKVIESNTPTIEERFETFKANYEEVDLEEILLGYFEVVEAYEELQQETETQPRVVLNRVSNINNTQETKKYDGKTLLETIKGNLEKNK